MFFETKYGKIEPTRGNPQNRLGMFFETKYGKIFVFSKFIVCKLGMFFETKYGKILSNIVSLQCNVRDVL